MLPIDSDDIFSYIWLQFPGTWRGFVILTEKYPWKTNMLKKKIKHAQDEVTLRPKEVELILAECQRADWVMQKIEKNIDGDGVVV